MRPHWWASAVPCRACRRAKALALARFACAISPACAPKILAPTSPSKDTSAMFTGIVEHVGRVEAFEERAGKKVALNTALDGAAQSSRLRVNAGPLAASL